MCLFYNINFIKRGNVREKRGGDIVKQCAHQLCMMSAVDFCTTATFGGAMELEQFRNVNTIHMTLFASLSCSLLLFLNQLDTSFSSASSTQSPIFVINLLSVSCGPRGNREMNRGTARRQKRMKTRHLINHLADKNRWLSHPPTSSILLQGKIFIGLPQNEALIISFPRMVALRLITSKYYVPYAFIFTD